MSKQHTARTDQSPPRPRCSEDGIRRFAEGFRHLGDCFGNAAQHGKDLGHMRWNLSRRWGVKAGELLCECMDAGGFPSLGEGYRTPDWDFRGDEHSERLVDFQAMSHQSHEVYSFALLWPDGPNALRMTDREPTGSAARDALTRGGGCSR